MNLKNIEFNFKAITLFLLLTGCQSNSQIKNDIDQWKGKYVVLPNENQIFNNKTAKTNPLSKKVKIITLVNGDCGPCVEELQEWKLFMKGIDTAYVGFVFLVNTSDIRNFKKNDSLIIKLKYPYYYDKLNKISKKNNFSQNKLHQTFLLDSNENVVLIGKPNTGKMYELYRSQIYKMQKNAVKGTIVTQNANSSTTNVIGNYIFKNEQGKVLTKEKADEMINSRKYMPSINDRDKVITLKAR
ncbi:hypothetical protein [Flavobacterium undicola]|uniref:hypothetical protein n=1 Tax=Flavobacterium undicola TaxID=1932779 RepID=UPI0013770271|nr:hypothetical protein [Flavobacterium undicola]MBA0884901.1 hypothetical protein [Flavobacterium undicola]